jgi:hypothetical protein
MGAFLVFPKKIFCAVNKILVLPVFEPLRVINNHTGVIGFVLPKKGNKRGKRKRCERREKGGKKGGRERRRARGRGETIEIRRGGTR